MKKLLFLGALLVVGSVTFAGVSTELKGDSGSTGSDLKGEATLKLTSRGNVIDPSGKAILILTPTVNAGADGESLSFDFGSMVAKQPQTLVGKFTAKVVTAGNPDGIEELPFDGATVTAKLEKIATAPDDSSVSTNGTFLSGLDLIDTITGTGIGDLAYELSFGKTSSTVYTGEVTVVASPNSAGSFINKEGMVTVSVASFTYTDS